MQGEEHPPFRLGTTGRGGSCDSGGQRLAVAGRLASRPAATNPPCMALGMDGASASRAGHTSAHRHGIATGPGGGGGPGRLRRHPKPHMGPASAAGCGATFEGRAVAVAWVCRPRGGAARYTFHGFGDDGLPIAAKGADVTKSGLSSVAYAGKNLASCTGTRPALPTCACLSVSVCVCSLVLAAMFLFLLVL